MPPEGGVHSIGYVRGKGSVEPVDERQDGQLFLFWSSASGSKRHSRVKVRLGRYWPGLSAGQVTIDADFNGMIAKTRMRYRAQRNP